MAATYAHGTAPLRRLADRYVVQATLAIANGQPVPQSTSDAFEALPKVMAKAGQMAAQIDRAVIDLAEAVMLKDRIGQPFPAIITDVDQRGARIQLTDLPVVARVDAGGALPGNAITVELTDADPLNRSISFRQIR
jgi:exoribonuclease R